MIAESQDPDPRPEASGSDGAGVNTETVLVQHLLAAWSQADVPAMLRCLSPQIEWRPSALSQSWSRAYFGHAAVQEWTQEVARRGIEVSITPESFAQAGPRVMVTGELEARQLGQGTSSARLAWVFEVHGRLITRGEGFEDEDVARAALTVGERPPVARSDPSTGEGEARRALVVDDDPRLRAFVAKLLTEAGYATDQADSVEAAQTRLDSGPVDVIVSDVMMPEKRGVELDAIAESLAETGIVYMSGYAQDVLFEHQDPLRNAILLDKPFEVETLLECVDLAYIRSRVGS